LIIYKKFALYSGVVEHLRDINTARLGIPPGKIYGLLLELPERVTVDELFSIVGYYVYLCLIEIFDKF